MDSPIASPMWAFSEEYKRRRVGVNYLAKRLVAETEAAEAAAAEAEAAAADTIEVILGALLRAMDSTGGESSMRKEAEEDSGKRSEIQRLAKALTEEFTSTGLAPERRKKLMKQHMAMVRYSKHIEEARALRAAREVRETELALFVREELAACKAAALPSRRMKRQARKSHKGVRGKGADMKSAGDLKLAKRKDTNKNTKNQKAQHEETVRPEVSVAEAGKAVAGMNLDSSDSFIQEESENELGKRPEMQLYAEEDYFRKAILRALLDIKQKLAKKTDENTLLLLLSLLRGMSNRLDQGGYDEKNGIDKGKSAIEACLDTNEGTHTTMIESDIKPAADPSATNSMIIRAETLRQMVKDFSDSVNATMVESDIKPAADPSATNSITIQAETLHQMVKDFSDSMRSTPLIQEHPPMVGSYKLLIQPADPSSTDSMTRPGPYSLQDDLEHDEMSDEEMSDGEMPDEETSVDKKMAYEAKKFADYRRSWEAIWSETCGSFEHMTALSSMQFTCYAPKHRPLNVSTPETLQIFSIKLAEISGGLEWPLSVYGVVAVRDVVDHNRNYLFYCDRNNSQELKKNDPFLRLIGPSRAVVHEDTVNFEVQLRVKGTTMSQDKALITEGSKCRKIFDNGASTVCIENCFCKIELCVQMVRRTTQATILGVQVVNPTQWPFKYGGRVACSSLPGKIHVTEDKKVTFVAYPASGELVMVDSKDGTKLKGGDGYLHLSRNVVSVEDRGRLDVRIQTYSKSGGIAAERLVSFPAEFSKITMKKCFFGHVKVVITIAWSVVATDKLYVMSDGALVQACGP